MKVIKSICVCLILSMSSLNQSHGQVRDASQNLEQQATRIGNAFIGGDYKTFASYTYPIIIQSMGGASKMADVLTKITNDMQSKGMSFKNITVGSPTSR